MNGSKNPHRAEVARDISAAIVKSTANGKAPAVYWSQAEQETNLQEVFDKWSAKGGVWTAAAAKVRQSLYAYAALSLLTQLQTHAEQLAHVKKGCLARPRDDIRSDGSRIENVHKGFNHLQRSFASGLETILALLHDFILRRNVRIELKLANPSPFVSSTYGSHHVRLVDAFAKQWNRLVTAAQKARTLPGDIRPLPELITVKSGETFGLMKMSPAVAAQQSFVTIKEEEDDVLDLSAHDLLDATRVLEELGIDPALLHQPLELPSRPQIGLGTSNVATRATIAPALAVQTTTTASSSALLTLGDPSDVKQASPVIQNTNLNDILHMGKGKAVDRSALVSLT